MATILQTPNSYGVPSGDTGEAQWAPVGRCLPSWRDPGDRAQQGAAQVCARQEWATEDSCPPSCEAEPPWAVLLDAWVSYLPQLWDPVQVQPPHYA